MGFLHGIGKLAECGGIGGVHLFCHSSQVFAGLDNLTVVAVKLIRVAQNLDHALHTACAVGAELCCPPHVLQRVASILLRGMEAVSMDS